VARKSSPVVDYAVYILIRIGVCILQMLSWNGARRVAAWLGWLAYTLDKRHRTVAMENLRHAFPGQYTDAQRDQMVRAVFRHFCELLTEIVLIPRKLHVCNHKKHLEVANEKPMLELVLTNQPVLVLTCHFGNWEFGGYYLGLCGLTTYAVARPLDNPYLDRFLRHFRENTGQQLLAKKGDFDRMTEVLAGGGVLATLGDQDAGQRGLFVNFFGRPASTHKAIALMALEQRVPILVAATYKVGEPMRYRMVTQDVIYPEDYADQPDAVKAITQRFTTALEELVRLAPKQYFWVHNRWKHQPARARKKAA
jgi:KDO2-lipid IV(A) lauroyltransferase